jgi:transposase
MKGAFLMGRKSKVSLEEKLNAVEDYQNSTRTVKQISQTLKVHEWTVRQWISKYQTSGASGLQNLSQNFKYPTELRVKAVADYLAGQGSLSEICRQNKISSQSVLLGWIKSYNGHEAMKSHYSRGDGLMTSGRKTTFEERVEIVSFCIENNDDFQLTAEKFQVSYQQVYTWTKKYKEGGPEALADRRGKRKDPEQMTEAEKLAAQVRLLEAENKRLQLEVGFLKKLEEVERRRTGKTNIQPSKNTTKKPDSR